MPRTVVNLSEEDKEWLDRQSAAEGVATVELVRRAVREYRLRHGEYRERRLEELLDLTRGCWRQGDGLRYQETLRHQWRRDI